MSFFEIPFYPVGQKYFDSFYQQLDPESTYFRRPSGFLIKRIEDQLFADGAVLIKRNKKQYIRFFSETDMLMFMLKWA